MKTHGWIGVGLVVAGCVSAVAPAADDDPTMVVLASELRWDQLNPARGDASPRAGTLWGDRGGSGPTGFLFAPADGFESPPHIHNVSYRGVVIRGLVHNDDPDAEHAWMPTGSFWTQPKGDVHITAAKGARTLAYIEIDEGPYLVRPVDEAFASEEASINVHASKLVWVDVPGTAAPSGGARIAFLWGEPRKGRVNGSLLELPAGFSGRLRAGDAVLRAIVIQGRPERRARAGSEPVRLEPGSYFSSTGSAEHRLSCEAETSCLIYVRTEGRFEVVGAARGPAAPEGY